MTNWLKKIGPKCIECVARGIF